MTEFTVALLGTPTPSVSAFLVEQKHLNCIWNPEGGEARWKGYDAVFVFAGRDPDAVSAETVAGFIGHPHLRVIYGETAEDVLKRLLREIDVLFSGEECERKFLVTYPDLASLDASPFAAYARIVQTYLVSEDGATERVRRRERNGEVIYTHTVKRRIDCLTSEEQESQIDALQYRDLLCRADPSKKPIEKTRYCILHQGCYFELDVYPFWRDRAIVELELSERSDEEICFPPQIRLIREVTDDVRYKNVRLAIEVPFDEIAEA